MREGTFKIDRAIAKVETWMLEPRNGHEMATLGEVLTMLREIRETDAGQAKP